MQPSYSTIAGLTLALLFLAAIGTRQPPAFYIAFASASVMLGLILAVRRWRFGRSLTGPQRRRLADQAAAAARARDGRGLTWGRSLLLLAFVALELVMLVVGVVVGIAAVQAVSGRTSDEMTFGLFMLGFLPGLALGGLLFWPLERLCKRWTGESAIEAFNFIPAGW